MSDVLSPLDGLLPELERLYADLHAHPELSHQESHNPRFAPVLHPTLRAGIEAAVTAALAWLAP